MEGAMIMVSTSSTLLPFMNSCLQPLLYTHTHTHTACQPQTKTLTNEGTTSCMSHTLEDVTSKPTILFLLQQHTTCCSNLILCSLITSVLVKTN